MIPKRNQFLSKTRRRQQNKTQAALAVLKLILKTQKASKMEQ